MPIAPYSAARRTNANVGLQGLLTSLQQHRQAMVAGTTPRAPAQAGALPQYTAGLRSARANQTPGMGLPTNMQAQQLYDQSGYMPRTTVGGNWPGMAAPGKQYRPLNIPGIGGVPMPGPEIPGSINTDVIGAGYSQRPLAGLPNAGSANAPRAYNYDPAIPEYGMPGRLSPTKEHRAQLVQRGLLDQPEPTPDVMAARRAATAMDRDQEHAYRRAGVEQRGYEQRDARRLRRGNLTFEERLQAGLPGYAQEQVRQGGLRDVADIEARGGIRQAEIGADAGAGLLGLRKQEMADAKRQKMLDSLPGLVTAGILTPRQAQAVYRNATNAGLSEAGVGASDIPEPPAELTPEEIADIQAKPAFERRQHLADIGITDPAEQDRILEEAESWWSRVWRGGGEGGDHVPTPHILGVGPGGIVDSSWIDSIMRSFVKTPRLVGPTRKTPLTEEEKKRLKTLGLPARANAKAGAGLPPASTYEPSALGTPF